MHRQAHYLARPGTRHKIWLDTWPIMDILMFQISTYKLTLSTRARAAGICVLLALACLSQETAAQNTSAGLYAGFTYDDNVSRAQNENDIEDDRILKLGANLDYTILLNDISYLSLRGTLDASRYDYWYKLNNTLVGIHADLNLRPSTGYTASRYLFSINYEQRLFESALREGSALRARLGFSKNLTDVVSLHAGYIHENIDADSEVFDASNNRLYLDTEFRTGRYNVVYGTLGYLDGNLVTTARAGLGIDYEVWVVDDAFTDLRPRRWAYRLSGKAISFRIGNNYQFGHQHALDISALFYDSEADNYAGSSYSGSVFNLSYLYSF